MSFEKYHSLNIFYPSSQSVYSYRSLADVSTDANAYLNAGERTRAQLAEDFVSDLFPFDQAACSSPQLVAWRGSEAAVTTASDAFFGKVAESAARRGYAADASVATMQTLANCS